MNNFTTKEIVNELKRRTKVWACEHKDELVIVGSIGAIIGGACVASAAAKSLESQIKTPEPEEKPKVPTFGVKSRLNDDNSITTTIVREDGTTEVEITEWPANNPPTMDEQFNCVFDAMQMHAKGRGWI